MRFYLHGSDVFCNGVYDKINDEHITPSMMTMIVNRLYELDKDFVLTCLKCDEVQLP